MLASASRAEHGLGRARIVRLLLALLTATAVGVIGSGSKAVASGSTLLATTPAVQTRDSIYNNGFSGFLRVTNTLTYFAAENATKGTELWRTDGTKAGTKMVKDILPGHLASDPTHFTLVGSTLYFVADDGVHGREIWKSNGTAAGTVRVSNIVADPSGPAPDYLIAGGSRLFFEAGVLGSRHLYSQSGSHAVRDHGRARGPFGYLGGYLYYSGSTSGVFPYTLFRTSGAGGAGTQYDPGPKFYEFTTPNYPFAAAGGKLFFGAEDGASHFRLWKTTGAAAGSGGDATLQLDHNGAPISDAGDFTAVGTKVFFAVFDGNEPLPWVTDGTQAGTGQLGDPTGAGTFQSYQPGQFVQLGSRYYFTAGDGVHGQGLWKTTGAVGNMTKVKFPGTNNQSVIWAPVVAKGRLYFGFGDYENHKNSLWRSDGTKVGTKILRNFGASGQVNEVAVRSLAGSKPNLLLVGGDAAHGREPWLSNGTSSGTKLLKDINTHAL